MSLFSVPYAEQFTVQNIWNFILTSYINTYKYRLYHEGEVY